VRTRLHTDSVPATAAPRRPGAALSRLLLSLRVDGLAPTVKRAWTHLFGTEERYVFVQYLTPPAAPVEFPIETNGLVVRQMMESDLRDPRVKRHEPHEVDRLREAVVATRQGQIVGAAWYTDSVTAEQPWYRAVEPHLIRPAWFDANIFVVAGDKGAAWAISKHATDRVATQGVRCTVALVGARNKRSILLLRLLGAKMVAQMSVRHWFGRTTVAVEPIAKDQHAAVTTPGGRITGAQ
jgi:hypothetical protein